MDFEHENRGRCDLLLPRCCRRRPSHREVPRQEEVEQRRSLADTPDFIEIRTGRDLFLIGEFIATEARRANLEISETLRTSFLMDTGYDENHGCSTHEKEMHGSPQRS